jgi:hypothetical protein
MQSARSVNPGFRESNIDSDLAASHSKCRFLRASIPPYLNRDKSVSGTPVKCATDCARKLCGNQCLPTRIEDGACPGRRSFVADIGFYNTVRNKPGVYPCCASDEEKRCASKSFHWRTTTQQQMNEVLYSPKETVCETKLPNLT